MLSLWLRFPYFVVKDYIRVRKHKKNYYYENQKMQDSFDNDFVDFGTFMLDQLRSHHKSDD